MSFGDDARAGLVGGGSGAATGAMLGSVVPGVGTGIGAAVGGGLGLLTGFLGSHGAGNAADTQRRALDQAMARLQAASKQNYADRMKDLDATMAFYNPAKDAYAGMFGGGGGQRFVPGAPGAAMPPLPPPVPPGARPGMGGIPQGAPQRMAGPPMGGGGPPMNRPPMPANPPGFPPVPGQPMPRMGRLGMGG